MKSSIQLRRNRVDLDEIHMVMVLWIQWMSLEVWMSLIDLWGSTTRVCFTGNFLSLFRSCFVRKSLIFPGFHKRMNSSCASLYNLLSPFHWRRRGNNCLTRCETYASLQEHFYKRVIVRQLNIVHLYKKRIRSISIVLKKWSRTSLLSSYCILCLNTILSCTKYVNAGEDGCTYQYVYVRWFAYVVSGFWIHRTVIVSPFRMFKDTME